MATRARIKVASIDIGRVNQICKDIRDIAEKTGVDFRGPIPLPTKRMKVSTRKSPSGEGKATWEKYELRVHKRLIDIFDPTPKTIDSLMRLDLPAGVDIEIKL